MGSVNKVILVGNLARDAELRYTRDGAPVASFTVATSDVYTDREGKRQEKTEWHRISYFGENAKNVSPYLTKGRLLYVEGQLQTRKYEKDGQTRYTTEIRAVKVSLLGRSPSSEREEPAIAPEPAREPLEATDDDIPF